MKPTRNRTSAAVQKGAKELRQTMTPAECILWEGLRSRRLSGLKLHSQHPIGTCIVDFYCAEARLVIEVDGGVHLGQVEADAGRSRELEIQGYRVIRFTNEQIEADLEGVLSVIQAACHSKAPLPNLGEGLG